MKKIALLLLFTLKLHAIDITSIVGGASNINYKVTIDEDAFFVRFAPKDQEAIFADLAIEHEVLMRLAPLKVSPIPYYYNPAKRVLITQYIAPLNEEVDLLDPATRKEVLNMLHTIENASITISREFKPYKNTMQLAKLAGASFENRFRNAYGHTLKQVNKLLKTNPKKTLCHLDLHHKNLLKAQNQLWIVDWEYAMMSHPFLVLASMASIERWDDAEMQKLLTDYMGIYSKEDFYLLYLYRIAIDLFWTSWNEVQSQISTIDNPYDSWKTLFEQAARDRISSPLFKKALKHFETHK